MFFRSVHDGPDIEEIIRIPDVMFNAARLRRRNFYDSLMNTLLRQPMQQVDSAVTYGVSFFFVVSFSRFSFRTYTSRENMCSVSNNFDSYLIKFQHSHMYRFFVC